MRTLTLYFSAVFSLLEKSPTGPWNLVLCIRKISFTVTALNSKQNKCVLHAVRINKHFHLLKDFFGFFPSSGSRSSHVTSPPPTLYDTVCRIQMEKQATESQLLSAAKNFCHPACWLRSDWRGLRNFHENYVSPVNFGKVTAGEEKE